MRTCRSFRRGGTRLAALLLALLMLAGSASAETLTLSLIGDCTLGDQYKYRGYKSSFTYKTTQNGLDYPFSLAADLFAADDLTIANCEGCFTTRKSTGKFMALGAAPEFAEIFKLGHVDVVNTANNHMFDFGAKGYEDTLDSLAAQDIGSFGDKNTYTLTVKGVKIGFVGYTYPILEPKLELYRQQIETLRADGCTFIIASAHWGKEESLNINQQQRQGAPALIDMGADMVYGHGSHTVQPIQIYKGKVIFYSLSNFVFGANAAPKDDDTLIAQVVYDIAEDGTCALAELVAIPYKMHNSKDFRPYPIEDQSAKEQVWRKLVFYKSKDPSSNLPDSFLTTGYANFRE